MKKKFIFPMLLLPVLVVVGANILIFSNKKNDKLQLPNSTMSSPTPIATTEGTPLPENQTARKLSSSEIKDLVSIYSFTAMIPTSWQTEAVPTIEAINIYNPAAEGASNLEKSQIFLRYFKANEFQTLQTVTVHSRENQTINGRPAVRYEIESKVGNFVNQPSWRSQRHVVTDIRVSPSNPSLFYVVAQRPGLSEETYQQFLKSLTFIDHTAQPAATLVQPIEGFKDRVTKKPFGILINRATSPVQPERFSGYHTGADVEYDDTAGRVEVKAIADGQVLTAREADGYGGVVAIRHLINDQTVIAIYGHLAVASLPKDGQTVVAGQTVGVLGDSKSTDTDGERKHLHFAISKMSTVDLKGYVQTKAELDSWIDPTSLY